jgi:4'-phosphopantetheinyl transferase EntD
VIASLLPPSVAARESRDDPAAATLFPEEAAAVAGAVAKRRLEFTTVRHCARLAMAQLGLPPGPIVPGDRREPTWPAGVVGSMTHCSGYRAAAVAHATDVLSVGIDAEEHAALMGGVERIIIRADELGHLRALGETHPGTHWDRMLFSAKESVYKTWFPLTGRWLGFDQAHVTFDPDAGTFLARLLVPGPVVAGTELTEFNGRWLVRDDLILTAIVLPAGRVP